MSRPCQTSSTSSGSVAPSAATAVLASRADTPMRSEPVMSFSSAQRPVSSSASSQPASCAGRSALPSVARVRPLRTSDGAVAPAWSGLRRPQQRDRLGQVADVVVGHREQSGIDALGHQRADQGRLGVLERQRPGERRERIAALGVAVWCGRRLSISRSLPLRDGFHRRGGRAGRRNRFMRARRLRQDRCPRRWPCPASASATSSSP